ncbi:MAG TPA: hypothetical protein DGG94_05160 [Micromonosporaceae bacterium]|nr:hypothetical protein [Micromonosporaceae bacterium]HCU49188.1 hypothetical protein [Micromonosporaceae bacterium]
MTALEPFFGGVSKATFNRHNTAHAVTPVHSEPNTLIALMLSTSLLRQLQYEHDQAANTLANATAATPKARGSARQGSVCPISRKGA